MPRQLAALICICLIFYLFWVDHKKGEGISSAIWIPFIWMFLAGSRYVSQWLNLDTPDIAAEAILKGNPVNSIVFALLIIGGVLILYQRKIKWHLFFTQNAWTWLYFVFGAISILWSDYPFVSSKRWVKAIGNVIMVLIILTEGRPYEALGTILRRLSFLLLPLSVLFIKYFPDLGRSYHMGKPMYTGVALQKNGLGQICLLFGIYFSWEFLFNRWKNIGTNKKFHYSIYFIILPMIVWCLYKSNSATSLVCIILAVFIFVLARQPAIIHKPLKILSISFTFIVLFVLMDLTFGLKQNIIHMLGRRPDLTTRVPMWNELLSMVKNPIVGYGFESFWLGYRWNFMKESWGISGQAHNGYIDMYLNLGVIGLFFIFAWILSGLKKVYHDILVDYPSAILRFCFIGVVALYNYTEATFYGVSNMWIIFLLGVIDIQLNNGQHKLRVEADVKN